MNSNEILKVISKQWCSLEDLKKLTGLGKNNLLKLKRDIKNNLNNNNTFKQRKLALVLTVDRY